MSSMRSVIILGINKSDDYHLYDYKPNWTPVSHHYHYLSNYHYYHYHYHYHYHYQRKPLIRSYPVVRVFIREDLMKATSAVWDKQRPIVPAIPFLFKSIIRTSLIFWFLIKHCCVTTTDSVIYIVRPNPKSGAPR